MKTRDTSKLRLTSRLALAVIKVVRAGLISGPGLTTKGKFTPGQMCVEQAISHALGADHENDHPRCVGLAVNTFKVVLNDNPGWTTKQARTKGMERLAVAQLGSNRLNQEKFYQLLCRELDVDYESPPKGNDEREEFAGRMESLVCGGLYVGTDEKRLRSIARAGLRVLQKMKSPGCKYLYLFNE
jgi:hypothetical protein